MQINADDQWPREVEIGSNFFSGSQSVAICHWWSRQSVMQSTTGLQGSLPEFTDFKLDPLDSRAAPHRVRESRRTFMLYLEPTPETPLSKSLLAFQDASYTQYGPNQAHDSTLHIPILGRIHIDRGNASQWQAVDRLTTIIEDQVRQQQSDLCSPSFLGYQIVQRPTRSLIMRVRLNIEYTHLARSVHRLLAPEQGVHLHSIPSMDRMHIAYNVTESIPQSTLQKLLTSAKNTIQVQDWVLHGGSWQLSLYELILESRVRGVKQQVMPIRSWPVSNAVASTVSPLLPSSLRVKLTLLSTRYLAPSQQAKSLDDNDHRDDENDPWWDIPRPRSRHV